MLYIQQEKKILSDLRPWNYTEENGYALSNRL